MYANLLYIYVSNFDKLILKPPVLYPSTGEVHQFRKLSSFQLTLLWSDYAMTSLRPRVIPTGIKDQHDL